MACLNSHPSHYSPACIVMAIPCHLAGARRDDGKSCIRRRSRATRTTCSGCQFQALGSLAGFESSSSERQTSGNKSRWCFYRHHSCSAVFGNSSSSSSCCCCGGGTSSGAIYHTTVTTSTSLSNHTNSRLGILVGVFQRNCAYSGWRH